MIRLSDSVIKVEIAEKGAEIISVRSVRNGTEYIWDRGPEYWPWSAPILFPFIGRLQEGEYTDGEAVYKMSMHGFIRDRLFAVQAQDDTHALLFYESTDDDFQIYPYRFTFFAEYEIAGDALKISFTVSNRSDKTMHAALGFHPGIRIPDTMLVGPNTSLDSIAERIGFPLVMKIMHGYQGRGVCLVNGMGELKSILDMVMAAPFGDQIIVQRAIQSSKGRDLRVVVGAGELVYAFVRHNDSDFKSNLHQGGYIEPYQPPQELVEQSIRLADAFGLKTGSIDYLFGENEGEFYLCEVNSVPGISYVFKAQKEGDDELVRRFFSMPKKILHREGLI